MNTLILEYRRRSMCPCGHPVLRETVPLGKRYRAYAMTLTVSTLICGGCGWRHECWTLVVDDGTPVGALPVDIFDVVT